ncbi:MAG TPA: hypothetical protein VN914_06610 [Polyangia bacterium]|nr:hypothetical protein [Polyangia bacterium]
MTQQALSASELELSGPLSISPSDEIALQRELDNRVFDADPQAVDFIFWGKDSATSVDQARGRSLLTTFTRIGTATVARNTTNAPPFTWFDGKLTKSARRVKGGVAVAGLKNGFRLDVPAPPMDSQMACTIYGQVLTTSGTSEATLTASLSDKSAPAQVAVASSGAPFWLEVQFGSEGVANLNFTMTLTRDGGGGKLVLYAMNCSTAEGPPLELTATPGATSDRVAFIKGQQITVTATALTGGPYTNLILYEDGVGVPTPTAGPYTIKRTPGPGVHIYQAQGVRPDGRRVWSGRWRAPVWINNHKVLDQIIPDGLSSGIDVRPPLSGYSTSLKILDVIYRVWAWHKNDSDLGMIYWDPSGQGHWLVLGQGGSGDNYTFTSFWDGAPQSITEGTPSFHGWFRPQDSLRLYFGGRGVNASYTFNILDQIPGTEGKLNELDLFVLAD